MTGVHKEKKKKRKIKIDALTKTSTSGFSGLSSNKKTKRSESLNDSGMPSIDEKSKKLEENEKNNIINNKSEEKDDKKNQKKLKQVDARNPEYENYLKKNKIT